MTVSPCSSTEQLCKPPARPSYLADEPHDFTYRGYRVKVEHFRPSSDCPWQACITRPDGTTFYGVIRGWRYASYAADDARRSVNNDLEKRA